MMQKTIALLLVGVLLLGAHAHCETVTDSFDNANGTIRYIIDADVVRPNAEYIPLLLNIPNKYGDDEAQRLKSLLSTLSPDRAWKLETFEGRMISLHPKEIASDGLWFDMQIRACPPDLGLSANCTLSREDARQMADQIAEANLGATALMMYGILNAQAPLDLEHTAKSVDVSDRQAHLFIYPFAFGGIPVAYDDDSQSPAATLVLIDDMGIREVYAGRPLQTEVLKDHIPCLSLEEAIALFKQERISAVLNNPIPDPIVYRIHRIQLAYRPYRNPIQGCFYLAPAWDFYGYNQNDPRQHQSLLTVNAVDGSFWHASATLEAEGWSYSSSLPSWIYPDSDL